MSILLSTLGDAAAQSVMQDAASDVGGQGGSNPLAQLLPQEQGQGQPQQPQALGLPDLLKFMSQFSGSGGGYGR